MKPVGRHQLAQARASRGQRSEKLTERVGIHLEFGYAGAFSGNPQKFNVHGVRHQRRCSGHSPKGKARNAMITWGFDSLYVMAVSRPAPKANARACAGTPKGRAVDPKAREDVRALLGDAPRRRDLLIEHLHKIQDRYGHLSAAHLVALAAEMKMAMAEVYEVATFYHHFDVVKDGETAPPAITVRVCDSIACDLAGSHELLEDAAARCSAATFVCCTRRAWAAAKPHRSPWSDRTRCRMRQRRRSSRS